MCVYCSFVVIDNIFLDVFKRIIVVLLHCDFLTPSSSPTLWDSSDPRALLSRTNFTSPPGMETQEISPHSSSDLSLLGLSLYSYSMHSILYIYIRLFYLRSFLLYFLEFAVYRTKHTGRETETQKDRDKVLVLFHNCIQLCHVDLQR